MAKKKTTKKKSVAKKPAKKTTRKKAAKKPAAKKSTAKKTAKKKSVKKAATKKTTTKNKPAAKPAKKTASKNSTAKKPTAKKAATKKPTTKKAPAKKPTSKKPTSKKPTAKKPATQKPATKKPAVKKKAPAPRPAPPPPAPVLDPLEQDMDQDWTIPKLRRVKTGLKKKDLNEFLQLLLEKRAEIIGNVQGMEDARNAALADISHMPLHMADVGSDNFEQEFTLGLMESEREMLREIEEAIVRMREGYYGVCLDSGRPINRARLEIKPWAKYCIEVARLHEKRGW